VPWFRLDDKFHSHPKVIQAGNEATGLFVRCGTYAAEHLTDGYIPEHVALLYGSGELAETLVHAKLWRRTRGGYKMPDYLDYNPSAQQVDKERALKAERQKRWLETRGRRKRDASKDASGDGSKDGAPTPSPTRPEGSGSGTSPDPNVAGSRADPPGSAAARHNGAATRQPPPVAQAIAKALNPEHHWDAFTRKTPDD
jgi:hypothetical protein